MLDKMIHWIIMPCSEASKEIEMLTGEQKMSWLQKQRLKAHLGVCRWCSAYKDKVDLIDSGLSTILKEEKNDQLKDIDIQDFKDKMKNKFKK